MPDWTDGDARTTPVDADRCLWCKNSTLDTDSVALETGEQVCRECLGDLREFKRTRFVDLIVASSLSNSLQNALLAEWADVQDVLAEWHADDPDLYALPARESHAHGRPQSRQGDEDR